MRGASKTHLPWCLPCADHARAGFTVLELLASVMVLGLIGSVLLGLSGPWKTAPARVHAQSAVSRSLDHASLLASHHGWSVLTWEAGSAWIASPQREDAVFVALPTAWSVHCRDLITDTPLSVIRFDAGGVSCDLRVGLTSESGDVLDLVYYGISGQLAVHPGVREHGIP